jgi:lipid A 3-O-deacylase
MAGLLATVAVLSPVCAASAGDPLSAGATSVGLGGSVSISHGTVDGLDTVTGLQLLPNVGYVVSDGLGSGWWQGTLEVLVEPTLMHLASEGSSSTAVGASVLGRWILGGSRIRPYLEGGVGLLAGEMNIQQSDCSVNFIIQGGPGVLVVLSDMTTLAVGYRFQHISNASMCETNVGINSSTLYLGVSYRFR